MIPVEARVRIPVESLEEMRRGLNDIFAPGANGRRGENSIIGRGASYPKDEMLVGAKIWFTWSRHEATAYVYERRKPGVKATSCICVGPISGFETSSDGKLEITISCTDWDTGKQTQSLMVLEPMETDVEAAAEEVRM